MLLSYMSKRLRRHMSETIVSAAIVLVVVVVLIGLHAERVDLLAEMDRTYEEMEIRCRVTSANGLGEIDLPITEDYVATVCEKGGLLYPYVKDVFLLETYKNAEVTVPPDSMLGIGTATVALHMTNDPDSYAPTREAEFHYTDGYSAADFARAEPVCLISNGLEEAVAEDGTVTVYVIRGGVSMKMKVIGTYEDDENTVFGAWQPLNELIATVGWEPSVGSMAFTVADNRQLDLTKSLLRDFFVPASRLNNNSELLGLIVDDSLFTDTMTVLERSMSLLNVVRTVVFVLSFGVIFLVAYLNIRARRLELAVMRSLGTRRRALYSEVLGEYMLFFLVGAALATAGMALAGTVPSMSQMKTVGGFMLYYLFGVLLAVVQATSGKIMQILKGKE
ncbi:MAG: ABC transporter permease [Clostridia bacterium]|nr:ABC transporter permease [Clostridia bacterium]